MFSKIKMDTIIMKYMGTFEDSKSILECLFSHRKGASESYKRRKKKTAAQPFANFRKIRRVATIFKAKK